MNRRHRYRGSENARRLRAFVLVLRHSGLRIGDAVTLERSRITGDKLFLYTAKTGTPVHLPLPDFVPNALDAIPRISERYFFWTGESKIESATGDWQRALKGMFKEAGIPDGHAHRFRDTFAVNLLQVGVPIERVSVLLGHSSIKDTERHYSTWVKARQEQLEADVHRSWDRSPEPRLVSAQFVVGQISTGSERREPKKQPERRFHPEHVTSSCAESCGRVSPRALHTPSSSQPWRRVERSCLARQLAALPAPHSSVGALHIYSPGRQRQPSAPIPSAPQREAVLVAPFRRGTHLATIHQYTSYTRSNRLHKSALPH